MTPQSAIISARILAYLSNGASMEEAFSYVLGPGYYDCLVAELYSDLKMVVAP